MVRASPVSTAPTTSSFSPKHLAPLDCAKITANRDEKRWCFGFWCSLYYRFDGTCHKMILSRKQHVSSIVVNEQCLLWRGQLSSAPFFLVMQKDRPLFIVSLCIVMGPGCISLVATAARIWGRFFIYTNIETMRFYLARVETTSMEYVSAKCENISE